MEILPRFLKPVICCHFSHGQGYKWSDVEILRHNGFTVKVAPTYESLFNMVAMQGTAALFVRKTTIKIFNQLTFQREVYKQHSI